MSTLGTACFFAAVALLGGACTAKPDAGSDAPAADAAGAAAAPNTAAPSANEGGFAVNEELAPAVAIPLSEELTVVTAINSAPGDYESIKRIDSVSAEAVRFAYSAEHPGSDGKTTRTRTRRVVRRVDLDTARVYRQGFGNNDDLVYPGSTALGTSALVLADLKGKGSAEVSAMPGGVQGMLSNMVGGLLGVEDDEIALASGTIRRVQSIRVPVIVNDRPMLLPGIEARGQIGEEDAEFVFLDDPANPLALRWRVGGEALQVIKISFRAAEPPAQVIAEALRTEGRAEVYGIYFDFGSATLRPESDAALRQIANALGADADWRVRLEGHTDSIGGAARNHALSEARAAEVKDALVKRYGISANRLTTAGHGATRPKAPNNTLVGRARNRRVELVRL